ncbi:hypothetical protein SAY87_025602 [Trapa incisa]|uniref:Transmembrane protein n=2 Tax=Trapa TaxID=22665 RepID=A0AAN7R1H7_TRANT|nr:hypothetical protein SAY87_025602 [Trapa incisa]KAK4786302.1 hypothetical protein SAY86_002991 [Trapa natans]
MAEQHETTSVPTSSSTPSPPPPPEKSSEGTFKPQYQGPFIPSFPVLSGSDMQMLPVMYPAVIPGINLENQDQSNRGAGIYAVPVGPYMRHAVGLHSNSLIPLTYNIPTRQSNEAGATGDDQAQQQQQQNPHQQPPHQRQVVVRRFQIAIQLDLLLILKLAAVIFLFNQDGSRQRLVVLIFLASLIYLYQTGALAPLIRWLSQGMQRAAPPPPRPPRAAGAAAENVPLVAEGRGNENAGLPVVEQAGAENEHQAAGDGNQTAENADVAEPVADNGANHLWGIVREIKMIVFGFISSLLPGFHNID